MRMVLGARNEITFESLYFSRYSNIQRMGGKFYVCTFIQEFLLSGFSKYLLFVDFASYFSQHHYIAREYLYKQLKSNHEAPPWSSKEQEVKPQMDRAPQFQMHYSNRIAFHTLALEKLGRSGRRLVAIAAFPRVLSWQVVAVCSALAYFAPFRQNERKSE